MRERLDHYRAQALKAAIAGCLEVRVNRVGAGEYAWGSVWKRRTLRTDLGQL